MGVNTNKQRIVLQTDAVLGNEPSRLLVAAMTDEARRRLLELQRLLLARMLYRLTHSHIPGIDTMSDEEIDRNIYLETKPVALFRLDRKTTAERRAGEEAFKKLEAEEKAKKTNQDVLDRGDAIMSVSTDYIPLLGSVLRAGLYNFARLNLGYDYASNRYGYTPLISSTIDVATIPLGVGTKQLAASYAGGIGGRYVGDTYFDSPYAGLFIGTLLGGPVYNTATNVASNVNSAYKGFRLGREFNRGINNALFFNTPIEHVSNNGVTIGSALDAGNEGIHLSPIGSSTTPRVELFLLNLGQFPFVRRGIWTFTNNTAPIEVKDLGYFGKGFNKDFDTKVNEGFKNFVYSNNYEGKFGGKLNVSFLTTNPSFGLLLSKNINNPLKRVSFTFLRGLEDPIILANNSGVLVVKSPIIEKSKLGGYTILSENYPEGTGGIMLLQEAIDNFITPSIEDLRNYYNSGFYARRLAKAGLLSERDLILRLKNKNLDNIIFGVNTEENMSNTYAWTGWDSEKLHPTPLIEYNISDNFVSIPFATIHEGSHAASLNLPKINLHNRAVLADAWDNVKPELRDNPEVKKYVDYILNVGLDNSNPNAVVSEMAGLLQNAFMHMWRNKLTPKLLLSDYDYISRDRELRNAIAVFESEYLKKLLAPGGIISSILLAIDNKNDSV